MKGKARPSTMYTITALADGTYYCECRIQDGVEEWKEDNLQKAIQSLIQAARVLNHTYINEGSITFRKQESPNSIIVLTEEEKKMVEDIRRGQKVVLDHNDYRIEYNLTEKECQMIQKIREGEIYINEK